MIIAKEIIDASINVKKEAEEAKTKAMWKSIEVMTDRVERLSSDIKDIMDTYFYLRDKDEKIANKFWNLICHEDKELNLDFCNAILDIKGGRCGVRPSFTAKGCFSNIYVTKIGVFFGPSCNNLYPLESLKHKLEPKDYESMLNAMCLLVESVPAYKERLTNKLSKILQGEVISLLSTPTTGLAKPQK